MFSDNSLLPNEAIRLAALGFVCERPTRYAALARSVRDFTSRIAGPSLELMGSSIALLLTEGLIASEGPDRDPLLHITEAGRAEIETLLQASIRALPSDVGRLALALKMRFLHLLAPARRREQVALMVEAYEAEIARLSDLAARGGGAGIFDDWLAHDIALAGARKAWLERLHRALRRGPAASPPTADAGRR